MSDRVGGGRSCRRRAGDAGNSGRRGSGGGQVGHRGQSDKKKFAFHRIHGKITHHSGGKQHPTAVLLSIRYQLLGSGLFGILCMDNKL